MVDRNQWLKKLHQQAMRQRRALLRLLQRGMAGHFQI
jgi:hypothetical protein